MKKSIHAFAAATVISLVGCNSGVDPLSNSTASPVQARLGGEAPEQGSCPEGYTEGTQVQSFSVNSNGTTVSTVPLVNGLPYVAQASGTYSFHIYRSDTWADASYNTHDTWATHDGPHAGLQIQIDGAYTDWGPYSSAHVYNTVFTGTGGSSSFRLIDNAYGDNSGSLSVKISACDPVPVPPVAVAAAAPTEVQFVPGGAAIDLDGTGSTDDGTIVSYEWFDADENLLGSGAAPTVLLGVGTHTITLVVTDDQGLTGEDEVTVTVLPATPRTCPEGLVQAATPLYTLSVSALGSTVNGTLATGKTYIVEASGTYGFGGGNSAIRADAGYRTANNWAVYSGPDERFQLQMNGTFTDWGDFTLTHVYNIAVTGAGGPASFRITDDAYGDNSGSLTVKVFACVPATLPTTTTVTFGAGPFVYSGSAFTATASVSPAEAGAATITYSGDCVNAGNSCTATATFAGSDGYDPSSATASITIDKAPTTTSVTFGPGPFEYNGSAFPASASVSPAAAGAATITYSGDCVNAGTTCGATAIFAGNDNYLASSLSAGITIKKAPTTTSVTFGPGPFVYNGSAFTATASVSPAEAGAATIAYSGDCVNAGSTCKATATFAGNGNYLPSSATAGITIAKAATTTSVSFGSGPFIYTGSAFTATSSVSPAAAGSATIAYSGDCVYAGNTCSATATYAGNGNFLPSDASTGIVIKYPVATNADMCKKGGWQYATDDLGNLFKNQGDCVSYVSTKGKNKGAGR